MTVTQPKTMPAQGWVTANVRRTDPLKVFDPITLEGKPLPERRWMVQGLIPVRSVSMLSGDGGTGKTLLAMQLATCAAIGQNFLGLATKPCKTLLVLCEDDLDELHIRQAAINEHYGVRFGDLENMSWAVRVGQSNSLAIFSRAEGKWTEAKATNFWNATCERIRDMGAQLVILDSLHDLFTGNENSRPEAREFIQLIRQPAIEHDGAVVITAHPSLQGQASGTGSSGSTAWNNSVRSRLYLTRPKDAGDDSDERALKTMKANYGSIGGEIRLVWQDGVFSRSDGPEGIVKSLTRQRAESAFLDCLDACEKSGRPVSEAKSSTRYATKAFRGMPARAGVPDRALEQAMNDLFNAGKIEVVTATGADRHAIKKIVRVTGAGTAGTSDLTH